MKEQLIAYLDSLSTNITIKDIKAIQAGISQLEEKKEVTKPKKK